MSYQKKLTSSSLSTTKGNRSPAYDPNKLKIGIVHFGLGAFHRAHQAVYTENAIANYFADNKILPAWGIAGISLRSKKVKDILKPQDCLYSVTKRDASGDKTQVIGCVRDALFAPEDYQQIFNHLVSENVTVVTITVTEKGYCHHPATGKLQTDHPDVIEDWQNWDKEVAPKSLIGWLTKGLFKRKALNLNPFTIVSCDNLPANGKLLKKLMLSFAKQIDFEFSQWIDDNVAFPCTMVDRITPAIKPADIENISNKLGLQDNAAIITEPFKQWVIEDNFTLPRPLWETAGAEFVSDVEPYEIHKLRLLNGCHSALAYLGYLPGYKFIYEVVADNLFKTYAEKLLDEITPTLPEIHGRDVEQYKKTILERFANPAVDYRCYQVAMDGSQKLPQRLLNPLRDCLANKLPCEHIIIAVAAWMRYVYGIDEECNEIIVQDPLAEKFKQIALKNKGDIEHYIQDLLSLREIFDAELASNDYLIQKLNEVLNTLFKRGVKDTFI